MQIPHAKDFKPVFLFIFRFLLVYLLLGVIYDFYIRSYGPLVDPFTHSVGIQSAKILSWMGFNTWAFGSLVDPFVYLMKDNRRVVDVYEGCNGLNVMIVFISFIVAWKRFPIRLTWYPVAGLLLIHCCNLVRVCGLFGIALNYPQQFYFMHKYLFTGSLFLIVFLLWIGWILLLRKNDQSKDQADPA